MTTIQQPPTFPQYNNQMIVQNHSTAPMILPTASNTEIKRNILAIKRLAFTQILIGIFTLGFGIGATAGFNNDYWISQIGCGIWGGVWIIIAGIIGVSSALNPKSNLLNGLHMGLCIMADIVAFVDGIFFAVAVGFYNNCRPYRYFYDYGYYGYNGYYGYYGYYGNNRYYYDEFDCNKQSVAAKIVYSILLTLMIAEFFVALTSSIYCCKGCCSTDVGSGLQRQQLVYVNVATGQYYLPMATTNPQITIPSTQTNINAAQASASAPTSQSMADNTVYESYYTHCTDNPPAYKP